jgi:hypothetical protein
MATEQTKTATKTLSDKVAKAMKKKQDNAKFYEKEPKVAVQGSPFYIPYFGRQMPIMINGFYCSVPLDGKVYKIPESFANEFNARIKRIDATQQRYGVLGANIEDSMAAGDVQLEWN